MSRDLKAMQRDGNIELTYKYTSTDWHSGYPIELDGGVSFSIEEAEYLEKVLPELLQAAKRFRMESQLARKQQLESELKSVSASIEREVSNVAD